MLLQNEPNSFNTEESAISNLQEELIDTSENRSSPTAHQRRVSQARNFFIDSFNYSILALIFALRFLYDKLTETLKNILKERGKEVIRLVSQYFFQNSRTEVLNFFNITLQKWQDKKKLVGDLAYNTYLKNLTNGAEEYEAAKKLIEKISAQQNETTKTKDELLELELHLLKEKPKLLNFNFTKAVNNVKKEKQINSSTDEIIKIFLESLGAEERSAVFSGILNRNHPYTIEEVRAYFSYVRRMNFSVGSTP